MKKYLITGLIALCVSAPLRESYALDFNATPRSAWVQYVGTPPPAQITDARLKAAMEWRVLGQPMPLGLGATPYGIQAALWERTMKNFGLPAVAGEYQQFLTSLRAELARNHKQTGSDKE